MMNTPKRVSFGSQHGSMVETMIIEELPAEEKHFYKDNLLQAAHTHGHSTGTAHTNTADSGGGDEPSEGTPTHHEDAALLRLKDPMESRDNPFLADGELSKKADYIIEHSRISRSEIRISDPDLAKKHGGGAGGGDNEEMIKPQSVGREQAAPPTGSPPHSNGRVDDGAVEPNAVKVDVGDSKAEPATTDPQDKKNKKTRGKCCVIQ